MPRPSLDSLTWDGALSAPVALLRALNRGLDSWSCAGGTPVSLVLTVKDGAIVSVVVSGGDPAARSCVERWARRLQLGEESGIARFTLR